MTITVGLGPIFALMRQMLQDVVGRIFSHFSHGLLNCRQARGAERDGGTSSNPITEQLSGTRRPASDKARIAP